MLWRHQFRHRHHYMKKKNQTSIDDGPFCRVNREKGGIRNMRKRRYRGCDSIWIFLSALLFFISKLRVSLLFPLNLSWKRNKKSKPKIVIESLLLKNFQHHVFSSSNTSRRLVRSERFSAYWMVFRLLGEFPPIGYITNRRIRLLAKSPIGGKPSNTRGPAFVHACAYFLFWLGARV